MFEFHIFIVFFLIALLKKKNKYSQWMLPEGPRDRAPLEGSDLWCVYWNQKAARILGTGRGNWEPLLCLRRPKGERFFISFYCFFFAIIWGFLLRFPLIWGLFNKKHDYWCVFLIKTTVKSGLYVNISRLQHLLLMATRGSWCIFTKSNSSAGGFVCLLMWVRVLLAGRTGPGACVSTGVRR